MPTIHLIIKGKVQGVFFRASAKEVAEGLGVMGWIKNTPDGDVEALLSGTDRELEAFVAWCRQGPSKAKVIEIVISKSADQVFEGFTILRG
jgi:acylphosphatase